MTYTGTGATTGSTADPGRGLPAWSSVLAVSAHPDDESFGLGALITLMTQSGTSVHVLCFTHGEASTVNETGADLRAAREDEFCRAGALLGVATADLLGYTDGRLSAVAVAELAGHVTSAIARYLPDGLLVFDEAGITGHPDHRAATAVARAAAARAGLPVLAWTLPETVACQLREETGQSFAGQPLDRIDLCVRVDRATQRRAVLAHASQISPGAVLWRRLDLLGDHEYLRWLRHP